MKKIYHSLLVAAFMVMSAAVAGAAGNVGKLGIIKVEVGNQIPIRVTANSPELENLARVAFDSHGLYKRVGGGQAYDFKFTSLGGNQVRVDITRGSAPFLSQTVTGTSARNALLRAADVAVEKTNGLNPSLHGFFAAKLAFVSKRTGKSEVYVSDLFGGEMMQLTHDGAHAISPRWSPNGSRIIYTSYVGGAPDIYLLDLNGQKNSFARYRGTNTGARFSPNGQQVAMVCGQGTSQIYTCDPQGRGAAPRTRGDAVKSSPCWSPDGGRILFAMDPGPQLYVISASGGVAQRFASGFSYMAEPDWSRTDHNKVVCTVRDGGVFKIAVVDVAARTTNIVSKAPYDAVEPSWLADGRHVICTMRDQRTSVLAILDTVTGNSRPVSTVPQAMEAGVLLQ